MNYVAFKAVLDLVELGLTVDELRARFQADEATGMSASESYAKIKTTALQKLDEAKRA